MAKSFGGVHPVRRGNNLIKLIASFFVFTISSVIALIVVLNPKPEAQASKAPVVVETEAAGMKMAPVLVPIQEIPNGTLLEPRMFRKESRPQVGIPERSVQDFEEIKSQYARALILPGIPLHQEQLTNVRPTNAVTANIPSGFRAVTIHVDARTSVEGFVRAGAVVDVEWASQINGAPGIVTIVESAKVLSAERNTHQGTPAGVPIPSTVSLLVTAKDAKKIQLASTTGKLSLSLRGDDDMGGSSGGGSITVNDLLPKANNSKNDTGVDGTVTIGGEKWLLIDGKMVPASKRNN